MIERIPSSDINRRLKEILERIERGESFLITRYGKDVAYLTDPSQGHEIIMGVEFKAPDKTVMVGSPKRSARDELLNRIRKKR